MGRSLVSLLLALLIFPCCSRGETLAADGPEDMAFFESRIRPVLVEKCYACHSAKAGKPKGGLRVDDRDAIRKGGDSGSAVVPGNPEKSLVLQAITREGDMAPMPPKETLPKAVVADFRRWIEMGAPDPRAKSSQGVTGHNAEKDPKASSETWWSLRPLSDPPVPVLQREQTTWVRNPIDGFIGAGLNARGLKPAPEADRQTLIRRLSFDLLGLPPTPEELNRFLNDDTPGAYERLVDRLLASPHFGERSARHWMDLVHFAESHGLDQDRVRSNAWPYRDYLIDAFNEDRPYDRFIQEQLAADALFPDQPTRFDALGMIAAGPWDESSLRDIREDSIDREIGHYIDRDDMVSTVISTCASMTVHCARCHDHKFDPISQQDYYGLQAVFAGVERADLIYDMDAGMGLRRKAMRLHRAMRPERAFWTALLEITLPPPRVVFAATGDFIPDGSHRPPGKPRPVHILRRGDIHKPISPAVSSALSCVESLPGRFVLEHPGDESSRRVALAKWLSDPRNSLAWRSIVNRLWQRHFGRGLVDTPNDFGRMGSLPSHPELLDWLASRLLAEGGSLKRLQRLMVTSATYRQATTQNAFAAEIDADNRLLWRMNRRRLDAESVRDAIVCVSGQFDTTMKGPSVRQFTMRPGVHVTPVVDYQQYDWNSAGASRRSVYRFLFRSLPDPFMDSLDGADASQLTATRNESATPLQALAMLNNPFVLVHGQHLARRLEKAAATVESRIDRAFELVLGRSPSPEEQTELQALVRRHGLASLCRLLLNSNEFLYVN